MWMPRAECTYDQPSNRRRNPAPQYIEALEVRLQKAEGLLKVLLPNVNLSDPDSNAAIQRYKASLGIAADGAPAMSSQSPATAHEAELRSMLASTGELGLDDQGLPDFHGSSSGRVFVHRIREQLGGLLGEAGTNVLPHLPAPPAMPWVDSPRSSGSSPLELGLPNIEDLPSKDVAQELAHASLTCCSVLPFIHQPTFHAALERIYHTPVEKYTNLDHKFLPLLYAVLATGCVFHLPASDDPDENPDFTYQQKIEQG